MKNASHVCGSQCRSNADQRHCGSQAWLVGQYRGDFTRQLSDTLVLLGDRAFAKRAQPAAATAAALATAEATVRQLRELLTQTRKLNHELYETAADALLLPAHPHAQELMPPRPPPQAPPS